MKQLRRSALSLRNASFAAALASAASAPALAFAQDQTPPAVSPDAPPASDATGQPVPIEPAPIEPAPAVAPSVEPGPAPARAGAQVGSPAEALPMKTNPEAPLESDPVPVKGKWNPVLYGFAEFDSIHDSTQSFNDAAGNAAIQRESGYPGNHGRTTFGVRNSRLGFKLAAPETGGVKATGILEMDFLGNQPPNATEAQFFTNPTFRIRHFAMKLENPYVDVLLGQYWQLFGWQSYFHPNTVEIQGVPGQVYSRSPQIRLSHVFKTQPVNVELAVAASRPPQRDSEYPDGQAGLRIMINDWKGLHTAGATGTSVDALALGVSGVGRRLVVPEFTDKPLAQKKKNAGGISIDALIPVIPATKDRHANALTLTGSYATGTGISDLYTGLTAGVSFPSLPNPKNASPAPTYTPDLDPGIGTFDSRGNLHTINWRSYIVGAQYYLPPSGKFWIAGNFSHMQSSNAEHYVSNAGKAKIFTKSNWADGNLFWDALPALRLGAEYAYFEQTYADVKEAPGNPAKVKDHRVQFSAFYMF